MKLNVVALAIAGAALWGACVFLVGLANMVVPSYGVEFLSLVASVYPGFEAGHGFVSVLVGSAFAVLDGAIGGAILAWLYNFAAVSRRNSEAIAGSVAARR
jgi:hypothetical protein